MALFRQSGTGSGLRNGVSSDHLSVGVRGSSRHLLHRRSKAPPPYKISIGFCVLTLSLILSISALFYLLLQSKGGEINRREAHDDDMGVDSDFLRNVTRTEMSKELKFGHGSVAQGLDSRYWDKDDRRRDEDYNEVELERGRDDSVDKVRAPVKNRYSKSSFTKPHKVLGHQGNGLYNEAGRNELKMYEAEFEASLEKIGESTDVQGKKNQQSWNTDGRNLAAVTDADEYDDDIDLQDDQMEEYDDVVHDGRVKSGATKPSVIDVESSHAHHARKKNKDVIEEADKGSNDLYDEKSLSNSPF
ncbi:hypothetical protein Sango_2334000 [Sesamum angolense]|uniref:Uncharacterized protein n=1 Tax=Sesamum angolense TaxID=2727404 RepID=A0AAE2BJ61_9LAMI|nr:hypothetical protein Sango_2334000 [Sesamum angolense]